jgi:hypothetical protein
MGAEDFSFSGYESAIRRSQLGRSLLTRATFATWFYDNRSPFQPLIADWSTQRLTRLWHA